MFQFSAEVRITRGARRVSDSVDASTLARLIGGITGHAFAHVLTATVHNRNSDKQKSGAKL